MESEWLTETALTQAPPTVVSDHLTPQFPRTALMSERTSLPHHGVEVHLPTQQPGPLRVPSTLPSTSEPFACMVSLGQRTPSTSQVITHEIQPPYSSSPKVSPHFQTLRTPRPLFSLADDSPTYPTQMSNHYPQEFPRTASRTSPLRHGVPQQPRVMFGTPPEPQMFPTTSEPLASLRPRALSTSPFAVAHEIQPPPPHFQTLPTTTLLSTAPAGDSIIYPATLQMTSQYPEPTQPSSSPVDYPQYGILQPSASPAPLETAYLHPATASRTYLTPSAAALTQRTAEIDSTTAVTMTHPKTGPNSLLEMVQDRESEPPASLDSLETADFHPTTPRAHPPLSAAERTATIESITTTAAVTMMHLKTDLKPGPSSPLDTIIQDQESQPPTSMDSLGTADLHPAALRTHPLPSAAALTQRTPKIESTTTAAVTTTHPITGLKLGSSSPLETVQEPMTTGLDFIETADLHPAAPRTHPLPSAAALTKRTTKNESTTTTATVTTTHPKTGLGPDLPLETLQDQESEPDSDSPEVIQDMPGMGLDPKPDPMSPPEVIQYLEPDHSSQLGTSKDPKPHPNSPPGSEPHPNSPPGSEPHPNSPPGSEPHPISPPGSELHPISSPGSEPHPNSPPGAEPHPNLPPGSESHPNLPPGSEPHLNLPPSSEPHPNLPPGSEPYPNLPLNSAPGMGQDPKTGLSSPPESIQDPGSHLNSPPKMGQDQEPDLNLPSGTGRDPEPDPNLPSETGRDLEPDTEVVVFSDPSTTHTVISAGQGSVQETPAMVPSAPPTPAVSHPPPLLVASAGKQENALPTDGGMSTPASPSGDSNGGDHPAGDGDLLSLSTSSLSLSLPSDRLDVDTPLMSGSPQGVGTGKESAELSTSLHQENGSKPAPQVTGQPEVIEVVGEPKITEDSWDIDSSMSSVSLSSRPQQLADTGSTPQGSEAVSGGMDHIAPSPHRAKPVPGDGANIGTESVPALRIKPAPDDFDSSSTSVSTMEPQVKPSAVKAPPRATEATSYQNMLKSMPMDEMDTSMGSADIENELMQALEGEDQLSSPSASPQAESEEEASEEAKKEEEEPSEKAKKKEGEEKSEGAESRKPSWVASQEAMNASLKRRLGKGYICG